MILLQNLLAWCITSKDILKASPLSSVQIIIKAEEYLLALLYQDKISGAVMLLTCFEVYCNKSKMEGTAWTGNFFS
ncbi:hypothetical protein FWJ32_05485 [Calorimonas adulescens]|uniref:Uncharacterized protein n=1 Tax=Calorimonas adulescens TaxID=2606906 RepID=A0A5D8QGT0_9THEO|nr:hypothetical protein FWJ32_05485 [Calorimonas adulescens]